MFRFPPCPLPPASRVWLYLRDSGGDNQDLASQRAYGLAYCQHHGLQLVRVFEDSAISGGSVAGRDEFTAMIDLAHSSKGPLVDGILYWDIKRFARNQLDSQYYKADLRRGGYRLVSLSDNIPDGDLSFVFEAFLEWKAQQDREDLSKDIKRGMAHIVGLKDDDGNYLGIFPGAPPTFFRGVPHDTGIKRNDGRVRVLQRLIPDPDTWPLGQRAWQMRAARASYEAIEQALRLFPGNSNPNPTYYHIFRNEIYIGRLYYSGQVYEDFVPALATPEQWQRVQELNYSRPGPGASFPAGKLHPKAGRGDFLLSGLCRCIYCQANIHGSTDRRRERKTVWRHYICATKDRHPARCPDSKRLPALKIERAVVDFVLSRVLTVDFVARLTEQVNAFLGNTEAVETEARRQQKTLSELERAIGNLVNEIELSPSPALRQRLAQREAEKMTLDRKLKELQEQATVRSIRVDEKTVLRLLTEMRDTLTDGEIRARQLILQSTVVKAELGRSSGRINYRFPLAGVYLERVNWLELNPVQVYEFEY